MKNCLLLFFVILAISSCQLKMFTQEFNETISVDQSNSLSIKNTNGSIKIDTWDKDLIEIHAIKKTHLSMEILEKTEINISRSKDITIEAVYPQNAKHFSISYELLVPSYLQFRKLETSNGKITISNLNSDVEMISSNGSIIAENIHGSISAITSNGSIKIKNCKAVENLLTTNGSIYASFHEIATNSLSITTSNGRIHVNFLSIPDALFYITTSNGSINTSNMDMLVEKKSKNFLYGKTLDGKKEVLITTSNGSIEISSNKDTMVIK